MGLDHERAIVPKLINSRRPETEPLSILLKRHDSIFAIRATRGQPSHQDVAGTARQPHFDSRRPPNPEVREERPAIGSEVGMGI
jgi:hypothetical protein